MDLVEFTNMHAKRVSIPVNKITGITETMHSSYGRTFVATGADGEDGGENGWYVSQSYEEVKKTLKEAGE